MNKCFNVIFTVLVVHAFLLLPDPPENANTPPLQHTQVMVGAPFSLNCTPSAANLPVDTVSIEVDRSPVTSGDTVTVTDTSSPSPRCRGVGVGTTHTPALQSTLVGVPSSTTISWL